MPLVKVKSRIGTVVSNKMEKTVVVAVATVKRHPLYGKSSRHTKRYKAHDEARQCQMGDRVKIVESRPLSKEKRWRVVEILSRQAITPPLEEVALGPEEGAPGQEQEDDTNLHKA